jgi:LmbE family N-acetylglucosaminyl deacetylase
MVGNPLIDLNDQGTPAHIWSPWREALPELPIAECLRLTVVAPHPGDEVLAAGGLIALARSHNLPVTIVAVSNGEASHPRSQTHSRRQLARTRIQESECAANELAADPPRRLGLPDGAVEADEEILTSALSSVLADQGGPDSWCVATWREDGHPDHEAVGRATAAACLRTATRLIESPIWMWHWATPAHPAVPSARAHKFVLPGHAIAAKQRAIKHLHSQIEADYDSPTDRPVLPPNVLDHFTVPHETFFL